MPASGTFFVDFFKIKGFLGLNSVIRKRLIVALTGPGPQVALGPKRTFFCFFCCFSAGRPLQTAKNKNVKRVKNKTLKRRNDHICGLKKGEHSEPFARRRHKLRIRTRLRRTPELGFLVFFCRIFIFLGPVWGRGPLRAQGHLGPK